MSDEPVQGDPTIGAFQDDQIVATPPFVQPGMAQDGTFQAQGLEPPRAFQTPDAYQCISREEDILRRQREWPLRFDPATGALWLEDEWTRRAGPPPRRTGW
jgi:hypothetical protein